MKTETHFKLALLLSATHLSNRPLTARAMFVAGCVQPDISPFSYLKGFKVRPFFGHNWENAKKYILTRAEKAEQGRIGYFEMGKFIHYLCDAFTLPHNAEFNGGLYDHVLYEKRLNSLVFEQLGSEYKEQKPDNTSLCKWIEQLHESYIKSDLSENTDAKFICFAADKAMSLWAEQTAVALQVTPPL